MYLPYWTIAGPVGAEQVVRVRDLLRRGVLDVDQEAGGIGGHLQVDRERDHREEPEQDDGDAEPRAT